MVIPRENNKAFFNVMDLCITVKIGPQKEHA